MTGSLPPPQVRELGGQYCAGSLSDLKPPPLFASVKHQNQRPAQALPRGALGWLSSSQPTHKQGQRLSERTWQQARSHVADEAWGEDGERWQD